MAVVESYTGIVDAARGLAPLLIRDREDAEDDAEMTAEVQAAAGAAGMFRLLAPREVGGVEASLPDYYGVMEELAAADPSVAWHAANSTVVGVIAASLGDAERDELFEESDHPYGWSVAASGKAARVEGGVRLSGRWSFVTGVGHARWCALSGAVAPSSEDGDEDAEPDTRVFVVRTSDLEVHPTFRDATSMRGTGSNAVSAKNVFVPDGFVFRWTDPLRVDRPLYRLPFYLWVTTNQAATAVGALRGALAGSIDLMGEKSSSITGAPHYDQPRVKEVIANADATIRALRAGMQESSTQVWTEAMAGPVSLTTRARHYASSIYSADAARVAVSELYARSSSRTYAARNPVERSLRDIHAVAAVQDSNVFRPLQMAAGRVLLGHDEGQIPRF